MVAGGQFKAYGGIYDVFAMRGLGLAGADGEIELIVDNFPLLIDGRIGQAVAVGGSVPGQLIRLKEGQNAVLKVVNRLTEPTSIHWHGLILPEEMDGVPGVSFAGIGAKETFTYRFPVRQSGTYWYHSHSAQELIGMFGPLIIDPIEPDPFTYDRDYVIMLHDWSFESPMAIITKLRKQADYYNFQKRTAGEFFRDVRKDGLKATVEERAMWAEMNMDPTDLADVTGYTYTYLMNGKSAQGNWNAVFKLGEKVRLRFVNAGAMTLFDVRIPGLMMTVVQADGQNVKPVSVDEFRIAPGETYDVIIEPKEEKAYAVFAETMDRSGFVMGTLAPREGMKSEVPQRRSRPVRTMKDMGMPMTMDTMPGMEKHGQTKKHDMSDMKMLDQHQGHDMTKMDIGPDMDTIPGRKPVKSPANDYGVNNSATPMFTWSRLDEPGVGLEDSDHKVLVYTDLQSVKMQKDTRPPEREIELYLTGNMQRYLWGINGKTLSEAPEPIMLKQGERFRLTMVNFTMMEHPMHLHGVFMELENGRGEFRPSKHTITIKPAERVSVLVTASEPGLWSFHCHLLIHMEMGMFRVFEVVKNEGGKK